MSILARVFYLVALVCGALAGPAMAGPTDEDAIAALETSLRPTIPGGKPAPILQAMADTMTPGVSIAFIENGRVKWTRTYGVADAASGRPVTPQTLFQAASMSKALAAAGALRLVEQGRIGLDEDVDARLRGWRVPASDLRNGQDITLRRLLSHTAGLTVSGFPGYAAGKPVPTTLQLLAGAAPSNTPAVRSFATPGGQIAYSGGSYAVADLLMAEITGEPTPAALRRLVLRPAGMSASTFEQPLPERLAARAAFAHGAAGLPIEGRWHTYPEYGAAGLWTTPSDYGRFVIAIQESWAGRRGALLKPDSVRAMLTEVRLGYGLGVQLGTYAGRPVFSHGGGNAGFRCFFVAQLDGARQGVVVMTNGDGGGAILQRVIVTLTEAYGWGAQAPLPGQMPRAPYVVNTAAQTAP